MRSNSWLGQLIQIISRDTPAYRAAGLNRLTVARTHLTLTSRTYGSAAAHGATATAPRYATATGETENHASQFEAVQMHVEAVSSGERRVGLLVWVTPSSYNGARQIGEHWRAGAFVVIDLNYMDERDAKRLVDFAAGLAFALRGTIERLANRLFLLSPGGVSLSSADKAWVIHQALRVPEDDLSGEEAGVSPAGLPQPRQLRLPADVEELFAG